MAPIEGGRRAGVCLSIRDMVRASRPGGGLRYLGGGIPVFHGEVFREMGGAAINQLDKINPACT